MDVGTRLIGMRHHHVAVLEHEFLPAEVSGSLEDLLGRFSAGIESTTLWMSWT